MGIEIKERVEELDEDTSLNRWKQAIADKHGDDISFTRKKQNDTSNHVTFAHKGKKFVGSYHHKHKQGIVHNKTFSNYKTTEDVDLLFKNEENLTEEFKEQAKSIFEAVVQSKVIEYQEEILEQMDEIIEQKTQEVTEALVSKIDDYLDYVVNEWMEENKVAIESGLKAELAEDFMIGLKNLFTEHYISIPEDQVDVVEGMAEKVETLQQDLDAAITERAELVNQLNAYKMQQIVFEVSENLSEVQMAKLQSLAENIEFVSESDYKEKLLLTKKKYFESKESEDSVVDPQRSLDSEESLDESFSPVMSRYVQSISRIVKK